MNTYKIMWMDKDNTIIDTVYIEATDLMAALEEMVLMDEVTPGAARLSVALFREDC